MTNTDIVINIKDTISATGLFNKVAYQPMKALTEEDVFDSCYIIVADEIFANEGEFTAGKEMEGYDRTLRIILHINLSLEGSDELYFLELPDKVISEIIKDTGVFGTTIDRYPTSIVWDNSIVENKKELEIEWLFKYRLCDKI